MKKICGYMKKGISIMLVVAFVMGACIPAFAENDAMDSVSVTETESDTGEVSEVSDIEIDSIANENDITSSEEEQSNEEEINKCGYRGNRE